MGTLPVMNEVKREARRREVELRVLPTEDAIQLLNSQPKKTNAILHVTLTRLNQPLKDICRFWQSVASETLSIPAKGTRSATYSQNGTV